jgi:hypothetical protein
MRELSRLVFLGLGFMSIPTIVLNQFLWGEIQMTKMIYSIVSWQLVDNRVHGGRSY